MRTRIEFVNERQTQALLSSMDRRAKLQLKLQQTVEGLSLVVLSYYAVGLIGYLVKGLKSAGFHVDAELVTGLAVPVVAGLLYWASGGRANAHLAMRVQHLTSPSKFGLLKVKRLHHKAGHAMA